MRGYRRVSLDCYQRKIEKREGKREGKKVRKKKKVNERYRDRNKDIDIDRNIERERKNFSSLSLRRFSRIPRRKGWKASFN